MKKVTQEDFGELYSKFGPMVLRRCRFILKDEEKALDAMQDVFLRIIESKTDIKNLCASLFYVTATRVCLNKIRSDKLRSGSDLEVFAEIIPDETSQDGNEKIEAEMVLEKIFENRDSKDRLISTLHFVDGLTLEETAAAVKMSVSGVRERIRELQNFARRFK